MHASRGSLNRQFVIDLGRYLHVAASPLSRQWRALNDIDPQARFADIPSHFTNLSQKRVTRD
jgi:hypothetical protein